MLLKPFYSGKVRLIKKGKVVREISLLWGGFKSHLGAKNVDYKRIYEPNPPHFEMGLQLEFGICAKNKDPNQGLDLPRSTTYTDCTPHGK